MRKFFLQDQISFPDQPIVSQIIFDWLPANVIGEIYKRYIETRFPRKIIYFIKVEFTAGHPLWPERLSLGFILVSMAHLVIKSGAQFEINMELTLGSILSS